MLPLQRIVNSPVQTQQRNGRLIPESFPKIKAEMRRLQQAIATLEKEDPNTSKKWFEKKCFVGPWQVWPLPFISVTKIDDKTNLLQEMEALMTLLEKLHAQPNSTLEIGAKDHVTVKSKTEKDMVAISLTEEKASLLSTLRVVQAYLNLRNRNVRNDKAFFSFLDQDFHIFTPQAENNGTIAERLAKLEQDALEKEKETKKEKDFYTMSIR
jgi:hypothetical protein